MSPISGNRRPRVGTVLLVSGAVAFGGFIAPPAALASPDGTGLVISEVYGGGGNTNAVYTHDFVELFNPTGSAISVEGMSVQYRSANGTAAQATALTGSVPAGGHYLVQEAQGQNGTTALPTPDAEGSIAMSGSAGVVYLSTEVAPHGTATGDVTDDDPRDTRLVDLVGYGSTAGTFENASGGAGPTPAPSNTTSVSRVGGRDSDDNSDDFTAAAPEPESSGAGGTDPEPEPEPEPATALSIAEIQGTGFSSGVQGVRVVTTGVVTAAYPTGGVDGLFLQTAGTGGPADLTSGASDGVFVHGAAVVQAMTGADAVVVGERLEVTGVVSERFGMTTVIPAEASEVVRTDTTYPVTPFATTWPEQNADREALEGMLLAPQGDFTVSDNYSLNRFAQIGIAAGTEPLRQPTDVAPFGSADAAAVQATNQALRVTLDDGAAIDFLGNAGEDVALPWLSDDPTIRVGEPVRFVAPVVLDYSFGLWRFQPTGQLTAGDAQGVAPATFGDTRTAGPADVGGDLQVASFNVLNYFTDLGVDVPGCSFYYDRTEVDPVTVRGGCDARGAAEPADFARQQDKIVEAINSLGAEVVSLEEIENSAAFGRDRDASLAALVEALNADLGADAWAFVPSPANRPAVADEDVIRTAFIYKPAAVTAEGESRIRPSVGEDDPFVNARDPLAQVFAPVGAVKADRFLLVANHFKSKGSAPDAPDVNVDDGQGAWNVRRTEAARALADWVGTVQAEVGVEKVYLDGDFNSYTYEDPMLALYDEGYTNLATQFDGGSTYLFDGLVGSLDHGLANSAALASTTGATVWNINSVESVALEYSRYNYNVTLFYDGSTPYRASDHDPLVFGIDTTPVVAAESSALRVRVTPRRVVEDKTRVKVHARVTSSDHKRVGDGRVTVREGDRVLGTVTVHAGKATLRLPRFAKPGVHELTVSYTSTQREGSTVTVSVRVRSRHQHGGRGH